ncbi:MAG: hypothetical protein ACYC5M_08250 [Anaerolineae bacterium]
MTTITQSTPTKAISWPRRMLTYAAMLLIGFAIGYVPMWLGSRESAKTLSEATVRADLIGTQSMRASAVAAHDLALAGMQSTLASAAIDAQRGDYESARQAASGFYTSLRAETDKGDDSGFSQAQLDGMEPMFAQRDEIISLLARNDPAAAERLSDVYVAFREIIRGENGA